MANLESPRRTSQPETTKSSLTLVCFLLVIASITGLCGWIYVTLAVLGYFGFPKDAVEAISLCYPFIYLVATIYFCWARISWRSLLTVGVILNLPVVCVITYAIVAFGFEAWLGISICLLFVVLWSSHVWYAHNRAT